ncbi:hypothetical protein LQZ18_02175 [Lachnospiraceae bacterium ZAX-1]
MDKRDHHSTKKDLLSKEERANATRRQDISNLDYISIPMDVLPFGLVLDDTVTNCEHQLRELSQKQILNLTGISNTDLKIMYGAANLPILTECDLNFTQFARSINQWGSRLYELGYKEEAAVVLAYGIEKQIDIKSSYVLLANIYFELGQPEKINHLIAIAGGLNSLMKDPIVKALASLCKTSDMVLDTK